MHPLTTFRTLGQLLTLFSVTMIPSMLIGWNSDDGSAPAFVYTFFAVVFSGVALWALCVRGKSSMSVRDGMMLTALFWISLGLFSALPLYLADPQLSIHDAVFESFSGITTTGATVINHIDILPDSVKFFRQILSWFGGMGIVVLSVAILPMLGMNSTLLFRTETSGPDKDTRIAPRIASTAKILWFFYLGLTLVCGIAYYIAGMSAFDAVSHAFTTVATGGFSTHNASFAYFDNQAIEIICMVFMLCSSVNYALHFNLWIKPRPVIYWGDPEVRFMLVLLLIAIGITTLVLVHNSHLNIGHGLRTATFHMVSAITSTGFTTESFSLWPLALPTLVMIVASIGGCAGSTSGGLKIIRVLLLLKFASRELKRVLHPNGVFSVQPFGSQSQNRTIAAIVGFFIAYFGLFVVFTFGLEMLGVDGLTAWSASAATLSNFGPALGDAAANYASLPNGAKWLLCLSMLMGRLEIFTLLVFVSPFMWRG